MSFVINDVPGAVERLSSKANRAAHDIAGHHGSRLLLVTTGRSHELLERI